MPLTSSPHQTLLLCPLLEVQEPQLPLATSRGHSGMNQRSFALRAAFEFAIFLPSNAVVSQQARGS